MNSATTVPRLAAPNHAMPVIEVVNAVIYFVATLALAAHASDEAMLLWPANAIAIGVLATRPTLDWRTGILGLAIAGMLCDLLLAGPGFVLAGRGFAVTTLSTGVNVAAIGAAIWLLRNPLRHYLPGPRLTTDHAWRLAIWVILIFPTLRAAPLALMTHVIAGAGFGHAFMHDWLAGAVGACLFAPAIYLFSAQSLRTLFSRTHITEKVLLLLATLALAYLAIAYVRFPFVVIGLPLTLVAFRTGAFGTACAGTITGALVIVLWYAGVRPHGLFPTGALAAGVAVPFPALAATLLGPLMVGLAIDDRREAVNRLQISERQLRESIACSPIGMCLADMNGCCTMINAAFTRMLGYTEDEARALPFGHMAHPQERGDAETQMSRLARGDIQVYAADRRYQHKDGSWVWARVTVSLATRDDERPSHYFAQIESIQERRLAEAKLSAERSRLDTTLRSIVDAVITTDENGLVTYANPAAILLLRQPLAAVEGRRLSEILVLTDPQTAKSVPDLLGLCIARLEVMERTEPCLLHRPDGSVCHISETVSPVIDADRFTGAVIVIRDATETFARHREMNHRATHDVLTDLANRFEFERRAKSCFERARHLDRPATLLMIDLDRFKQVNDRSGHAAGDALLVQVADALRIEVRDSDTVARLGGDEFAILLDGCAKDRAALIGAKVVRAVQAVRLNWNGIEHSVGASVGAAQADSSRHEDAAAWLNAADSACYEAKDSGRGQLRVAG